MQIYILGSGTGIPNSKRGSSGYFLSLGKSKILFDCGNGTTWKLEKLGINYLEIDHIFITHLHPDHNSDLIPFLFATKYPVENKRTKPLKIWGPRGFKNFFYLLAKPFNGWIEPQCLEINELEANYYEFEDFNFYCIKTPHTESSLAFKINSEGKILVYSGDTDFFEPLVDFSRNCNLLIVECSLPDKHKAKGHMTPSEVIKLINQSNPKKTVLTHLYPVCDELDFVEQIRNDTGSDVIVAEDLMKIKIIL